MTGATGGGAAFGVARWNWRRWALGLVLACVLIAPTSGCVPTGDLVTRQLLEDAQRRRERGQVPTATSPPATPIPSATPSPTRTPRPGRTLATVVRVWDGNTILIEGGYSVRYIGVDAPGAGMFRRPVEPFGRETAERNVELVEGKQVELEEDTTDLDAAGNLLRWVYVEDTLVNEALILEGLARVGPLGANTRYSARLRAAEAQAREVPLNIWTLVTPTPSPTREPTDTPPPSATPPPTRTPFPLPSLPAVQVILTRSATDTPLATARPVPTAAGPAVLTATALRLLTPTALPPGPQGPVTTVPRP